MPAISVDSATLPTPGFSKHFRTGDRFQPGIILRTGPQ